MGSEEQIKVMQIEVVDNSTEFCIKRSEHPLKFGSSSVRVRSTIPLVNGQLFYLPFGNEDCMDLTCAHLNELPNEYKDSPWGNKSNQNVGEVVPLNFLSLENIIGFLSKGNLPSVSNASPMLIGRIVAKTRLLQLKVTNKKCPFYFMIDLSDGSLSNPLRVVFWETLCPRFFNILNPGHIVRIQGYTYGKDRDGNLEFKLNPRARGMQVDVLSEEDFKLFSGTPERSKDIMRRIPIPNYAFKQTKDVVVMERQPDADANIFDFAGVVSYVGPIFRSRQMGAERKSLEDENNYSFEIYNAREYSRTAGLKDFSQDARMNEQRWVKVRDGSSGVDLVVLIYTNSQSEEFSSMKAGNLIVFTNLRLQNSCRAYRAFEQRSVWAVSTWKTRYVNSSGIGKEKPANSCVTNKEICGSPYVTAAQNWWNTVEGLYEVENDSLVGPKESLYIPSRLRPSARTEYVTSLENITPSNQEQSGRSFYAPILRFRDVGTLLNSLHWSEMRLLTVQAVFVSLTITNFSTGGLTEVLLF